MKKKFIGLSLFISILFLLSACNTNQATTGIKTAKQMIKDIDQITVQLVNMKELPQGTRYTIRFKNDSSFLIKQNSVFVSMPIKLKNGGSFDNKLKAEATGNKLDIKPGEEVTLNAFIPIENYKDNAYLDKEHPQCEVKGYLNEVTEKSLFHKIERLK